MQLVSRLRTPTGNFYLKTVVTGIEKADAGQKEFDRLYVAPYHMQGTSVGGYLFLDVGSGI